MNPKKEKTFSAIIWDLDGVLADTEPLHREAWRLLFLKKNLPMNWKEMEKELKENTGTTDVEFLKKLFQRTQIKGSIEEWMREKRDIYWSLLSQKVKPMPGAMEILDILKDKFVQAIASNGWRGSIEIVLDKLNLKGIFRSILGREDVTFHKPHPEIYLKTAHNLGVSPSSCAVLEDSPVGVRAAKRAGMRCIAVKGIFTSQELKEADLIVNSWQEKEKILSFLGL